MDLGKGSHGDTQDHKPQHVLLVQQNSAKFSFSYQRTMPQSSDRSWTNCGGEQESEVRRLDNITTKLFAWNQVDSQEATEAGRVKYKLRRHNSFHRGSIQSSNKVRAIKDARQEA